MGFEVTDLGSAGRARSGGVWESRLCPGHESIAWEISPRRVRCQLCEPPELPQRGLGTDMGTL